ncbi:syndecan-2 [Ambystoma mexicanum]|uniref:syndecan-2 n=1 Tax=Ambystoma mexicanum TaxID=8296 RepID=UPI0037E916A4
MPALWVALVLGFVACVSGQTSVDTTSDKDLYMVSSGVYPIDDDDYSGSGSGTLREDDDEDSVLLVSPILPDILPTGDASDAETTTLKAQSKIPAQTKVPDEIDKVTVRKTNADNKKSQVESVDDNDVHTQKHSDSFFHKTEVLAAVIAGGVIGFLFALFLILLLVYRMRKKDEGSYDLGERKPSSAAYQKAPTKEFYA